MKKCMKCGKPLPMPAFDGAAISFMVLDKSGHFESKTALLCRAVEDSPGCAEDLLGEVVPDLLPSRDTPNRRHEG